MTAAVCFFIASSIYFDKTVLFGINKSIRLQKMCFCIVGKLGVQDVNDFLFQIRIFDREEDLDTFI